MKKTAPIPAIIHLVFLTKNQKYPDIFDQCIARIKELHPAWRIKIYDEDDANEIIKTHFPAFKAWYDGYPHLIQKADIFRVILVYLFGGFYMDMDMLCMKPLDGLRHFQCVLSEEKTMTSSQCKAEGLKEPLRIANYMFGSTPKHPFWLIYLRVAAKLSQKAINFEDDILESTGPGLLSNLYAKNLYKYPDVVLIKNIDRKCMTPYHRQIACNFGNYATHLHQGTWRWESKRQVSPEKKYSTLIWQDIKPAIAYINKLLSQNPKDKHSLELAYSHTTKTNAWEDRIKQFKQFKFTSPIKLLLNDDLSTGTKDDSSSKLIVVNDLINNLQDNVVLLNTRFTACIVTNQITKNKFRLFGVTIPVHVVHPGFLRLKRNFYDESETSNFIIGCTVDDATIKYFDIIISAFEDLKKSIPLLRLKVYSPDNSIHCFQPNENKHNKNLFKVYKGSKNVNHLSDWYKDVSCNLFFVPHHKFPFNAFETSYLGIPTIIAKIHEYQPLINERHFTTVAINPPFTIDDNKKSINIETIKDAILNVYYNYKTAQKKAQKTAYWLEDRFLIENAQQQLLSILKSL